MPTSNMSYNQNLTLNKEQYLNALLKPYKDPVLEELLDLFRTGAIQKPTTINERKDLLSQRLSSLRRLKQAREERGGRDDTEKR